MHIFSFGVKSSQFVLGAHSLFLIDDKTTRNRMPQWICQDVIRGLNLWSCSNQTEWSEPKKDDEIWCAVHSQLLIGLKNYDDEGWFVINLILRVPKNDDQVWCTQCAWVTLPTQGQGLKESDIQQQFDIWLPKCFKQIERDLIVACSSICKWYWYCSLCPIAVCYVSVGVKEWWGVSPGFDGRLSPCFDTSVKSPVLIAE